MPENKTKATGASVDDDIAARASDDQKADCKALMAIFSKVTKQQPTMWGPSIVGDGSYRYTDKSGRTGEMCIAGFAIRGREFVVYLAAESEAQQARLSKLGTCKMGESCLYFKRLADPDEPVLEQLIAGSIAEVQRRYGRR
jgi:hypothetical protein